MSLLVTRFPTWMPDDSSKCCLICSSSFHLFRRRHHCRACGLLVCNGCSTGRAEVRSMEDEDRDALGNGEETKDNTGDDDNGQSMRMTTASERVSEGAPDISFIKSPGSSTSSVSFSSRNNNDVGDGASATTLNAISTGGIRPGASTGGPQVRICDICMKMFKISKMDTFPPSNNQGASAPVVVASASSSPAPSSSTSPSPADSSSSSSASSEQAEPSASNEVAKTITELTQAATTEKSIEDKPVATTEAESTSAITTAEPIQEVHQEVTITASEEPANATKEEEKAIAITTPVSDSEPVPASEVSEASAPAADSASTTSNEPSTIPSTDVTIVNTEEPTTVSTSSTNEVESDVPSSSTDTTTPAITEAEKVDEVVAENKVDTETITDSTTAITPATPSDSETNTVNIVNETDIVNDETSNTNDETNNVNSVNETKKVEEAHTVNDTNKPSNSDNLENSTVAPSAVEEVSATTQVEEVSSTQDNNNDAITSEKNAETETSEGASTSTDTATESVPTTTESVVVATEKAEEKEEAPVTIVSDKVEEKEKANADVATATAFQAPSATASQTPKEDEAGESKKKNKKKKKKNKNKNKQQSKKDEEDGEEDNEEKQEETPAVAIDNGKKPEVNEESANASTTSSAQEDSKKTEQVVPSTETNTTSANPSESSTVTTNEVEVSAAVISTTDATTTTTTTTTTVTATTSTIESTSTSSSSSSISTSTEVISTTTTPVAENVLSYFKTVSLANLLTDIQQQQKNKTTNAATSESGAKEGNDRVPGLQKLATLGTSARARLEAMRTMRMKTTAIQTPGGNTTTAAANKSSTESTGSNTDIEGQNTSASITEGKSATSSTETTNTTATSTDSTSTSPSTSSSAPTTLAPDMTATDLYNAVMRSSPIIIDIRSSDKYIQGHIPRAVHCPVTLNDITKQIPLSIIFHRKQNLALLSQLNNPESSNDTIEKAEEASTTKTTSTQGNVDGSAEPTIVQIISDTDGRTLRNRMHRYVIIYSEGVKDEKQAVCEDEKKRVEYLAKLLTEERKVLSVYSLMGGFAEYQNRYPALICTIDPKKVEGYTEKVDDSTGGGESGVVTQVKEGESQEQSKTDESSPTEQWAGIVKKTTHAHLSTMGFPSEILDGFLYLGSKSDAARLEALRCLGITHILNTAKEIPNYHEVVTKENDTEATESKQQTGSTDETTDKVFDSNPTSKVASSADTTTNNGTPSFSYLKIGVTDEEATPLSDHFESAFAFIDTAFGIPSTATSDVTTPSTSNDDKAPMPKGRVLIHCQMGISRSSTIVIAYLMRTFKITALEAYLLVKKRRDIVTPNEGFFKQLVEYEKTLLGEKATTRMEDYQTYVRT